MSFTDDMFKSLEKSISNEITKDAKKELKKAVGKGLSALTGDDVKITSKGSGGKQTVTAKSKKSSSSKSSSTASANAKAQAQAAKDDAKAAKEAAEQQKENGIQGMIELCQDMGGTPDVAKQRIMDSFSLSDKQAREYIDKYWKVEEEPEPEPQDESPAAEESVRDASADSSDSAAAEAAPAPEDIEPEPDPVPDAIQAMINTCKDFGTTRDDAKQRIASTFSLSEEEAADYVDRVWPE